MPELITNLHHKTLVPEFVVERLQSLMLQVKPRTARHRGSSTEVDATLSRKDSRPLFALFVLSRYAAAIVHACR